MYLGIIGLNHNTASVEVREKIAVKSEKLPEMYKNLLGKDILQEAVILSTCNRVEYYVVTEIELKDNELVNLIADTVGVDGGILQKHSYCHRGANAVKHVISVASGLDSLVLGEPQIFGQIKDAFDEARKNGALSAYMNRLHEFVLKTTKKVRTDTGISENAVSVSYAAVELAKKIFDSLKGRSVLIIGAGQMCELAAEHLAGADVGHIYVTNRTYSRAQELARKFYGTAVAFELLPEILHKVDIVISSTGATEAVVTKSMVAPVVKKRKEPMFFIDIAVPRDIESAVAELNGVYVYDIDDLKQVVDANRKERQREAEIASELIAGSVVRFERWMESLSTQKILATITANIDEIKRNELHKFCAKNKINDPEEMQKLLKLLDATVNKIMHTPYTNIKNYSVDSEPVGIESAAKIIFGVK